MYRPRARNRPQYCQKETESAWRAPSMNLEYPKSSDGCDGAPYKSRKRTRRMSTIQDKRLATRNQRDKNSIPSDRGARFRAQRYGHREVCTTITFIRIFETISYYGDDAEPRIRNATKISTKKRMVKYKMFS